MGGLTGFVSDGQLLVAIPIAVLAGVVSFASPCILPLVPGYLAYIGGYTDGRSAAAAGDRAGRNRLVLGVVLFVLGFAVVFVVIGFLVGSIGWWLLPRQDLVTRIAGIIVILLGLVFVGQLTFLQRTLKPTWRPVTGLVGAPLLGAVFAIGWSPCVGPTLGAIYALGLTSSAPWQPALLALVYALGLGIPFVLLGLGLNWAAGAVTFLKRHIRAVNLVGGSLLILIGVVMVSGIWTQWMLGLQGVIPNFVPAI